MKTFTIRIFYTLFCVAILLPDNYCYGQVLEQIQKSDSTMLQNMQASLMSAISGMGNIGLSPTASQIMRYGEIPVSLSTGVPEIRIPIHTIKTDCGLEIPIDITYHASGVKVSDVATPVGLGWVLNAGGTIYRQNLEKGYVPKIGLPPYPNVSEVRERISLHKAEGKLESFWSTKSQSQYTSNIYQYNINGEQGYILGNVVDNIYECIPLGKFKCTDINPNHLQNLIDDKGNKWYFMCMVSDPLRSGIEQHNVSQVVLRNGEKIMFTYEYGNYYRSYYLPQQVRADVNIDYAPYISDGMAPYGTTDFVGFDHYEPLLKKIEWKDLTIEFTYKQDRQDIGIDRLDNIVIKSGTEVIKTVKFLNGRYFGTNPNNYRMLLEGIKINSDVYAFTYNKNINLPAYNDGVDLYSYQKVLYCHEDFWGYYNGTTDANWLPWRMGAPLPPIDPNPWDPSGAMSTEPFYVDGLNVHGFVWNYVSNRECNPHFSQAGIIQQIVYPTGGKTIFEFENNRSDNVYGQMNATVANPEYFGGLRVRSVKQYDVNLPT